jgi:hypothetical protein
MERGQAATCNRVPGGSLGLLVAAWHLSPELSHKRRKGFRAWAEPCVASIDAAGLGGGATLAEPGPAAGGGVGGPWTVIAIHASTDHRSPSAEAPCSARTEGGRAATCNRAPGSRPDGALQRGQAVARCSRG